MNFFSVKNKDGASQYLYSVTSDSGFYFLLLEPSAGLAVHMAEGCLTDEERLETGRWQARRFATAEAKTSHTFTDEHGNEVTQTLEALANALVQDGKDDNERGSTIIAHGSSAASDGPDSSTTPDSHGEEQTGGSEASEPETTI